MRSGGRLSAPRPRQEDGKPLFRDQVDGRFRENGEGGFQAGQPGYPQDGQDASYAGAGQDASYAQAAAGPPADGTTDYPVNGASATPARSTATESTSMDRSATATTSTAYGWYGEQVNGSAGYRDYQSSETYQEQPGQEYRDGGYGARQSPENAYPNHFEPQQTPQGEWTDPAAHPDFYPDPASTDAESLGRRGRHGRTRRL